ncbi:hypothetical protein [Methyloversatilis sp. XJ19-49]|uniref:hypothetical protein n=1 Tax=Methyloversatilis sp. XJ19-49 TaxID=2963429 RepID=UPI00211BD764|nr:hypothetical protein [Methyloversatilis sp. XJ19-49]MCQ9378846.1 hypothetical protein [Methyloversatilis sp. XJ19-49]
MNIEYEHFGLYPKGTQMAMTGEDWTSEQDKKRRAKAEARRKAAAAHCAKKLEVAADSLRDFLRACNECNDGSGDEKMGAADGRLRLESDLREYASFLDGRF